MSPIRWYVDEDACENAVIVGLRAHSVDLLTTLEAGRAGTTNEEQLKFAVTQQRSMYTLNVSDFARIHRDWLQQGRNHLGIIVIPDQRYSIGERICLQKSQQPGMDERLQRQPTTYYQTGIPKCLFNSKRCRPCIGNLGALPGN